jgi:flagellar basal-body rod modification protein FlgD
MELTDVLSSTSTVTQIEDSDNTTLSSEDFYELLIAELQNQDPLEPMSNTEMVSQLMELNSAETLQTLTETLTEYLEDTTETNEALVEAMESLTSSTSLSSSASMIGKTVSYYSPVEVTDEETGETSESDEYYELLEGEVTGVNIEDGEITLVIDGEEVSMDDVTSISA